MTRAAATDAGAEVVDLSDATALAAAVNRVLGLGHVPPDATPGTEGVEVLDVLGRDVAAQPARSAPVTATPATALRESRVSPLPRRLGIGPANFAGQGWAWGRAVEKVVPGLQVEVFARPQGTLTFPSDRVVPVNRVGTLRGRLDEAEHLLRTFTHLLAEANRPLLGGLLCDDATADIALLQRHGIDVAVALHGSEVRDPSRHAELEPFSPFRDDSQAAVAYREWAQALVDRTTAMLASFDGPVFVSTPDLLDDVPTALWLPVVVDPDRPQGAPPLSGGGPPVVLHAPSKAVAKGTALVEPLLHRLAEQGVIRYRAARGVAPEAMPALLAEADVVLDQFSLGSYGVLACEAMAAGRVVVGNVGGRVRDRVRDLVGEDPPLVQATPDDLEDVLRGLLADPDGARAAALRGLDFVGRVHDGHRSGQVLADAFVLRGQGPAEAR